ncbi:hypothetical protein LTR91_018871 [Friedmanniomyces endolithicus]|uniref:Uncharacterized protein n=2 Tax=Friedmanniomyces endolithicus TaxID=329885 RepID=A0AAN6HBZ9_9PEZI|nr:hypothetical protein LTS09_009684 [Friedmanniomyces endolithicus]KAK0837090.1 hypothetical protein LTR03_013123 [Friedmanniomyces endolithicus]KAK0895046.1 hypothetical protein LTR02_011965 [Friedmanniomyces endolithicus]KAK0899966.1 hypothetical protein LTR57_020822 [Friedmanniomyces endolithicus]KAK0963637.1 hypothetical protein LTR91_018871 [Friedmanniomyces endolithicus]
MMESIFIVSNGPKVPKEARTTIRKQAMRNVGNARKKRNGNGRVIMPQMPHRAKAAEPASVPSQSAIALTLSGSSSSTGSSSSSSSASRLNTPCFDTIDWADYDEVIPRDEVANAILISQSLCDFVFPDISPLPEYERTRSRFGVDLQSLSLLTNFNVGKSTIALLAADPTRLASLLDVEQRSYLKYVPERYGRSACLTAATDCLLARVRAVLAPNEEHYATCNRLYGKALHALQDAITCDSSNMDADVLCATQLLSLHELLDPSRDTAWSHHVQGSARLVRHRSASRFHTDFERALFAAHVGSVVSECLMNNTHCYLEQREWSALYTSLSLDSDVLTDRSPLAISLRVTMFELPGIWHDVGEAVNGADFDEIWPPTAVEARCRRSHQELLDWLAQYHAHSIRFSFTQSPPSELSIRRELYGSALECLAIVKRLLCTVCEPERRPLEAETQTLAHLLLDLQKQPGPAHSWLFSGHELGVAYTILLTKDQWADTLKGRDSHDAKIAVRTRYNNWCNTLRMPG